MTKTRSDDRFVIRVSDLIRHSGFWFRISLDSHFFSSRSRAIHAIQHFLHRQPRLTRRP
jgi:hypothetical protein